MSHLRSPLAAVIGPSREPDPAAARRAARDAWLGHGIVLINPEWLDSPDQRSVLVGLAEAVHGMRAADAAHAAAR